MIVPTTWKGRLGGLAQRLALAAVSVVLALLACEALVRSVRPQLLYRYPAGLYVADRDLGYRLAPHFEGEFDTPEYRTHVSINAQGLREDREYGPKGSDTFRILFLGDSFTMGHSVEENDTFVKLLEELLQHHGAPRARYEVINAGVPGYNTEQELSYLEREGIALAPDLVLLGFFIGNDVRDNALPTNRVHVEGGVLVSDERPGILPIAVRRHLAAHSHLYHLLWPYQRALLSRTGREQLRAEALARIALYRGDEDATIRTGWAATERQLTRLARLRQDPRPLQAAVVVIPDPLQVAPAAPEARLISSAPDVDLDAPSIRVSAMARTLGIPALDLLPVFRTAASATPIYFVRDGHLTVEGNHVAARALMQFLVTHALVPTSGERYAHAAAATAVTREVRPVAAREDAS